MSNSRYIQLLLILMMTQISFGLDLPTTAITFSGGSRLGDKIEIYKRTKWLSYKNNIPLLLPPFKCSEKFNFHVKERHFSPILKNKYKNIVYLTGEVSGPLAHTTSTLYVVTWQTRTAFWNTMRKDQEFKEEFKKMLMPRNKVPLVDMPKGVRTVGMHIRKPSGTDQPLESIQIYGRHMSSDHRWPTKFPPEQYYIDSLIYLSEYYNDEPLYVFLFTDGPDPKGLLSRIQYHVNKPNIKYNTFERSGAASHINHQLEDVYNMARFDCMIKSSSHFSNIAYYMTSFEVLIMPKEMLWQQDRLVVTKARVERYNQGVFLHDEIVLRDAGVRKSG